MKGIAVLAVILLISSCSIAFSITSTITLSGQTSETTPVYYTFKGTIETPEATTTTQLSVTDIDKVIEASARLNYTIWAFMLVIVGFLVWKTIISAI